MGNLDKILLRFSSELSLKGPSAKRHFISKLKANIQMQFELNNISVEFSDFFGGLLLTVPKEKTQVSLSYLKNIFGIGSFSLILATGSNDFEEIKSLGKDVFLPFIKDKSFATRVKKLGTQTFKGMDLERQLGGILNQNSPSSSVNLSHPDITVHIMVQNTVSYFFTQRVVGAGGYPIGVEDRALCLMSGGFDSAVAAWRILKRGVPIDFLFCNMAGSAYERMVLQVTKVLCDLWALPAQAQFYTVDFSGAIEALKENVDNTYRQVILKRLFYRVANKVAYQNRHFAIITGEALGQVSSQTLMNLNLIQDVSYLQVLRPLIGYDKLEIINEARHIGTAALSERIKEYCSISTGHPVTRGKKARAMSEEEKLPHDLVEQILESITKIDINSLDMSQLQLSHLFKESIPRGAQVIDCQPSFMYKHWHLEGATHNELTDVIKNYKSWDKKQTYFLYCTHGTQTPHAAEIMQQGGYDAYCFKGDVEMLKKLV
ncbi:MAG: tRNA 4-thiouridine(8) synthase ThiI [Bdellovibrionaceae bacterium]|nr:tRNA 4-thiouridine(8) synthase ThiI [Pseudobdellovibrionaceae bacterium]